MAEFKKISRRNFISCAAVVSPFAVIGAPLVMAKSPSDWNANDKFSVGCLNVGAYSHLDNLWAPLINPRKEKKETPFTGMRITHCWDIDSEKAMGFAQEYGCDAVREFDAMADTVDGVISGGYYNHPWNHILHQPYIERGLPNLINRPFSNSINKSKSMLDLARKSGATILVPSAHELNSVINSAKEWAAGKKILCYEATNSFDDYPTHGIHGVYMICRAIAEAGNPVISVGYQAESWYRPPGVMTFEHTDKDGHIFFGTLHHVSGSWATVRIHTAENYGGKGFDVDRGVGEPFNKTEIWAPTLWVFQKMAFYGDMPQSFDAIEHKHQAFMAGWYSILEKRGAAAQLNETPEDWQSPVELPNHPGDETVSLFKKRFG